MQPCRSRSARRAGTTRRARHLERRLLPARARTAARSFDELAFYAEHFDTVEVNSTFYGQPRPDVTRAWAERTPAGFEFSVKLYQKFTHPGMSGSASKASLPADGRTGRERCIGELARPNRADVDEFRRGIDPLATAGKLGALLAQFPASFKDARPERAVPRRAPAGFRGLSGRRRAAAPELERRARRDARAPERVRGGLGPDRRAEVPVLDPAELPAERPGLLLHAAAGRNAAKWWRHDKAEDRYDYLYSADELQEFTETSMPRGGS